MSAPMPRTFVIGAGPVAVALAGGLRLGGVPVMGLWARRGERARAAAATAGVAAYSSAPPDLLLESHAVILAVRDDAIAEVAETLVRTGLITRNHVMLHCSGSMSAAQAFGNVLEQVGGVAVIHPLRAIADGGAAMRTMAGTRFGVEGDSAGLSTVRALVGALDGKVLALSEGQIAAYHAAAAVVSNYLVALVDVAVELLGKADVDSEHAIDALLPLLRGTVDNLAERGLPQALTGPIRRGDSKTVERHLDAIGEGGDLAELYQVLGRRTLALARELGDAPEAELERISKLLRCGPAS
ncbi:MAG: DUF2520 domain-containing protein [Deltaproteobacteria bacterium]|nr:DUF2520 domain-containing protein [Deltaproteobacteria bacterium]